MDLTGKTVLITGSSRGIGAAIALAFAQKGANIALNSRHALASAQVAAIQAYGVDCVGIVGDVTQDAAQIIDQVLAHFGHLDVLVNNAGITADKLLIRMQPADFAQTIQTNLVGTFNMIQHSLKPLFKQRSGCIINLASVVALTGNIGQANYAASKAGIIGLTKSVAREAALRQVRCNALAPGMITTAMTQDLSTKVKTQIETEIPLKRFGTPEEVAQAAIFLAENDYMTGQTIAIDVIVYPAPIRPGTSYRKQEYSASCKPAFSYGWDWSPRLIAMGLCGDAYLEYRPTATIEDVGAKIVTLFNNVVSKITQLDVNYIKKEELVNTDVFIIKQQNESINWKRKAERIAQILDSDPLPYNIAYIENEFFRIDTDFSKLKAK